MLQYSVIYDTWPNIAWHDVTKTSFSHSILVRFSRFLFKRRQSFAWWGTYCMFNFHSWHCSEYVEYPEGVKFTSGAARVNPRRHSTFRHPSRHRGGGVMRPPSWLAPEWARAPIQKPARCLSRDEAVDTREFKVLGQPVTSEVRSMTQNRPKCDFADNFVSVRYYLSKLEPRFKDQNVPYGHRNTMRCIVDPYGPFWGSK